MENEVLQRVRLSYVMGLLQGMASCDEDLKERLNNPIALLEEIIMDIPVPHKIKK